MNTHTTRSYVRKLSTSTLLAILSLSAIVAIIPVAPVIGSTGHTILGTVNSETDPTTFTPASVNVTVPAGHALVTDVNGTSCTVVNQCDTTSSNYLAIDFSDVNWQGAAFQLSLSKGGSGSPQAGDMLYTPNILVSDFCANNEGVFTAIPTPNGTFYIGWIGSAAHCYDNPFNTGVTPLLIGPVPILVSSAYTFIKMNDTDLTPTATEAVSTQQVVITPGIEVINATTPSIPSASGPALTPVIIKGGGFASSGTVNINYTYDYWFFNNDTEVGHAGTLLSGISTGPGWFTTSSTPMVDTAQAINPVGSLTNNPTTSITLFAVNASIAGTKPALSPISGPNSASFTEFNRAFIHVESFTQSYFSAIAPNQVTSASCPYYGNDTGAAPDDVGCDLADVVTYVFSPVIIAGEDFSVSSPVTFWIGTNELSVIAGSGTTTADGSFNATVEIPVIHMGTYNLVVHNDNVNYTFTVDVNPTVVLNDSLTYTNEGPASNPSSTVTVYLYGFPASTHTWIYWNATSISTATWYYELNMTTTASGETNTSIPDSFAVPQAYGGLHEVSACEAFEGVTFSGKASCTAYGTAEFGITPTLVVSPSSFNSTYAEPGNSTTGLVQVYAEGLLPNTYYSVNIDNLMADFALVGQNSSSAGVVVCTPHHFYFFGETCTTEAKYTLTWTEGAAESGANGVLNLTFVGAGFNPGVHVVSLTSDEEAASQGNYSPYIYALFTVTPQGSWEYVWLNSINNSISGFTGSINTLSSNVQSWINSAVSNINSNTNGQISSLSSMVSSDLSTVESDISSLSNSVSTIQSDVSTIMSDVSNIQSDVSTIMSNVTTIQTDVSSVMGTVGGIQTTVGGLSGVSTQATNIMNAVNTEQTYVLVVAVLAAIILVLVLAVLIRKLS